jgi:hypothetical protein
MTVKKKQKTKTKSPSVVFLLAGALFDYHMKVAQELRDRHPKCKLSAFISGRHYLVDNIKKLDDTPYAFNRYDVLNDMTTQWLNTPVDYKRLEFYRKKLGDDILRKIITADREIGYGYVVGGYVERTPLIDYFEKNPDSRWSYVIGLLDYCFDLIKDQKPDVIYTYGVAGADAIALHFAAHYHNIPAVQLSYARYDDYYVLDPCEKMTMPLVKKRYEDTLKNPKSIDKDAYKMASDYIDDFYNRPARPIDTDHWIRKIKKENSVLGFAKTLTLDIARWGALKAGLIGSRGIWRQRYGFEILKMSALNFWHIQKFIRQKQKSLNDIVGDSKFIYFPLHIDPEMTTMVMADKLTDQISVIEHLSKSMPAGWKIIVKDHIPMIGKRPSDFYKRLKNIPDVYIVSPFEDNFECMKQATLISTITGTTGLEAMLLGKTPLIIGLPHYINVGEGFVHCTEPTNFGQAIKDALKTKPISREKLKNYMACMLSMSFKLSTAYYWFKGTMTNDEMTNSINGIVNAIEEHAKIR